MTTSKLQFVRQLLALGTSPSEALAMWYLSESLRASLATRSN